MSDGPYRTVYEEMMGKYSDRKGVIVDTRFNGGGDLVSDLTMFFTGKKYLEYATERRPVGYEPNFRWNKPTVAMFNEANYSDGHCFACGYKELGIGKTIGMPVPGTCSFAGWEMLQDGNTMWGAVPVSTKDSNGQWLENVETVPDVVVKNEPGIISKGRDQQLERAVEELLKVLR
jgi:C-terminal processing protease CtpA/Prc